MEEAGVSQDERRMNLRGCSEGRAACRGSAVQEGSSQGRKKETPGQAGGTQRGRAAVALRSFSRPGVAAAGERGQYLQDAGEDKGKPDHVGRRLTAGRIWSLP